MLKLYLNRLEAALRSARVFKDETGVVSFEYVIVASCIVAAVIAAFGTGTGGAIATALTNAINGIVTAIGTVVA